MSSSRSGYLPLLDVATTAGISCSDLKPEADANAENADGADDAGPLLHIPEAFIERELLLEVMQKRIYRARQCRSVPLSVFFYFFFCLVVLTHIRIPSGFDLEDNLVSTLVDGPGFTVSNQESWYGWFSNSLVPAAFGSGGGYLTPYDLCIGGVRLVTTRSMPAPCVGLPGQLPQLYGQTCYPETSALSSYSTDSFGNQTAAQQYGVLSAFNAVQSPDGSGVPEFEFFIDCASTADQASAVIAGLAAGGWLDASTREVKVQMAFINGEVASYARVEWIADFTRGSRVATAYSVISVQADPYAPNSARWYLFLFDFALFAYFSYLVWGSTRRLIKTSRAVFISPDMSACGAFWMKFWACLSNYWRLVDVTTCLLLFAVFVSWLSLNAKLQSIRNFIDSAPVVSPAAFSAGPSVLQYDINDAGSRLSNFKVFAALTLVLFTLRLFKYFRFQSRLAVLGQTFAKAWSDMVHHSFLFLFILVMFAVVGHLLFGTQSADWASLPGTFITAVMFSQYDYNFSGPRQQYPFWSQLYYTFFMVLMTNLLLWCLLGILLDHYSEVRYASHQGPSAFEELGAYLVTLPQQCGLRKVCGRRKKGSKKGGDGRNCWGCEWFCYRCCCGRKKRWQPTPTSSSFYWSTSSRTSPNGQGQDSSASPQISVSDLPSLVSWSDVVRVLKRNPALRAPGTIIRPVPLAKALDISTELANLLIADAVITHRVLAGIPLSEAEDGAGVLHDGGSVAGSGASTVGSDEFPPYDGTGAGASAASSSPVLRTVGSGLAGFGGVGVGVESSPLLSGISSSPPMPPLSAVSPAAGIAVPSSSASVSSSGASTTGGANASANVDTARSARALYGAWDSKHFPSLNAIASSASSSAAGGANRLGGGVIRTARSNSSGSGASAGLLDASPSPSLLPAAVPLPPGLALPPQQSGAVETAAVGVEGVSIFLAPHPATTAMTTAAPLPLSPAVPAPISRSATIHGKTPSKTHLPALAEVEAIDSASGGGAPSSLQAASSFPLPPLYPGSTTSGSFSAPSEAATAAATAVIAGYGGAAVATSTGSGTALTSAGPNGGFSFFSGRLRMASRLQQRAQRNQQQVIGAAGGDEDSSGAAAATEEEDEDRAAAASIAELSSTVTELKSQVETLVKLLVASQQQQGKTGKGE